MAGNSFIVIPKLPSNHTSLCLLDLHPFVIFLNEIVFFLPFSLAWLTQTDAVSSVVAVSAAEDETAAGRVSREDGVHAAGRSRLLLRRSRSDAAFLL